MVEYCNENNYKIVDVSSKLTKHCDETANFLNDLFQVKMADPKYNKVLFFINSTNIHPSIKKNLLNAFKKQHCITEFMCYFNNNRATVVNVNFIFKKNEVKEFFNPIEEICCICLEKCDGIVICCPTCTTKYHLECIDNPSYKHHDGAYKYCCVCKKRLSNTVS